MTAIEVMIEVTKQMIKLKGEDTTITAKTLLKLLETAKEQERS